jgi:selenocysteine lyase/cysteine desulfurase
VAALAARARSLGVRQVAVDGAQVLGMLPVGVGAADYYAASPHKWLQAPKGLGVLYVKRSAQESLAPMWVKRVRSAMPDTAEAFEDYSTRNLPEVVTLSDAIAFQTELGAGAKTERYMEIRGWFRAAVRADARLAWRSAELESLSASLFAIEPVGRDARAVQRALDDAGIVVRAFGPPMNTLRVSPNLVNTADDVARFIAAVAAA